MDRTVPTSGNEEINLYIRTYYSLLRSTHPVQIKTLVEAHKRMNSALHVGADEATPDLAAFIYSILRMPDCLHRVKLVVMGQSARVFAKHGIDLSDWQEVNALGRRRRSFFDGDSTLGVFIASRSDIDDLVPILTAYQIERRKLHDKLRHSGGLEILREMKAEGGLPSKRWRKRLAAITKVPAGDWKRLHGIWQAQWIDRLIDIAERDQELSIQSLAGTAAEYKRATRRWWKNVERAVPDITFEERPVYFVSSNTHSLPNLLSGYPVQQEHVLDAFIRENGPEDLRQEYEDIRNRAVPSSRENFLYYAWKKYESAHPAAVAAREAHERELGIVRVPSQQNAFDIEVQVAELCQLRPDKLDARLRLPGIEALARSDALIINIDYPLGMGAYQVLTEISRNIDEIRGVFVMGKAATLNAGIGDVMVPSTIHDEQSLNTYLFHNCFEAADVAPHLIYGTVLDNQKAITVPGTFLQNEGYMSVFYQEGYTDMEMEAGPYLSSIYEMSRPKRYPVNELVNLTSAPFPVGILHYASDTPFSKGKNLGTQNLSYFGMDPTYAAMIAILRALLAEEIRQQVKSRVQRTPGI